MLGFDSFNADIPVAIVSRQHFDERATLLMAEEPWRLSATVANDLSLILIDYKAAFFPQPPKRKILQRLHIADQYLMALKAIMPAVPIHPDHHDGKDTESLRKGITQSTTALKSALKETGQLYEYRITTKSKTNTQNIAPEIQFHINQTCTKAILKNAVNFTPISFKVADHKGRPVTPESIFQGVATVKGGDDSGLLHAISHLSDVFANEISIDVSGPETGWSAGCFLQTSDGASKNWLKPFILGCDDALLSLPLDMDKNAARSVAKEVAA